MMAREKALDVAGDETVAATVIVGADARKLHYEGAVTLLVTNPRDIIKKIIDITTRRKGYLERINPDSVVVQIPATAFDETFNEILALGKVLEKLVTTADITAAYTSVELRLRIARATRDRLVVLLGKATDEEQKIKLLEQIEQLNAKIQILESMFAALNNKVNYSTITVTLEPYHELDDGHQDFEPLGMAWINELSPYREEVAGTGKMLKFNEPPGMLRVNKDRTYWSVESGDRVMFRAYQRDNILRGDTNFWTHALSLRMTPKYKSVAQTKVGEYIVLRMESFDEVPVVYCIGLEVRGDAIRLIEIFFPDATLEEKYKAGIFASIGQGAL